jgi:hypothetical protein
MSSIFDKIIAIGESEDDIRSNQYLITNSMIKSITIDELEYIPTDFSDSIVLTGSKIREQISNDDFNKEFSKKTFDLLTYIHWDDLLVDIKTYKNEHYLYI